MHLHLRLHVIEQYSLTPDLLLLLRGNLGMANASTGGIAAGSGASASYLPHSVVWPSTPGVLHVFVCQRRRRERYITSQASISAPRLYSYLEA